RNACSLERGEGGRMDGWAHQPWLAARACRKEVGPDMHEAGLRKYAAKRIALRYEHDAFHHLIATVKSPAHKPGKAVVLTAIVIHKNERRLAEFALMPALQRSKVERGVQLVRLKK